MDWEAVGAASGFTALLGVVSLIVKQSFGFAEKQKNGNQAAVAIEHRLTALETDVRHIRQVVDELRKRD